MTPENLEMTASHSRGFTWPPARSMK